MDSSLIGKIVGGCGCLLLMLLSAWLVFVTIIGLQGRGNDEEAAIMLGSVTCVVMVPIFFIVVIGLFFGFRQKQEP